MILIVFYSISRSKLATLKMWNDEIKKYAPIKYDNPDNLKVKQMSFAQTNAILMNKGPDAPEFKDRTDFGNFWTGAKYKVMQLSFLLRVDDYRDYNMILVISFIALFRNTAFYCLHLFFLKNNLQDYVGTAGLRVFIIVQ